MRQYDCAGAVEILIVCTTGRRRKRPHYRERYTFTDGNGPLRRYARNAKGLCVALRAKKIDGRALGFAIAIAIGLFISLCISSYARSVVEAVGIDQSEPFVAWFPENGTLSYAVAAVIGCLLGAAAYLFFTRFARIEAKLGSARIWRRFPLMFERRSIVIAAIAIFVLWIPVLYVMFPGGLTVDTHYQLYEYQTTAPTYYSYNGVMIDAEMIDHHPWFDTLLYGWFWQIGYSFGSQEAGIFLFTVLQSAVLASCLGASVCYLERLRVPYPLRVAACVFCALFPFIPQYSATVLKDSTYLMFFLPWLILWMETARTRGALLDRKGALAAFLLLGGMCILTKKLGVIVFVICAIALFCVLQGRRVRVAMGTVACIVVFSVALPAVASVAVGGIAPGGKQETLAPAIQQITALINEDPDALSEEEWAQVEAVIDVDMALEYFEPYRADGAKGAFRPDATTEDIVRFMQVWASAGLRHPYEYLRTVATTTGMLYVPFMKFTSFTGNDYSQRAEQFRSIGTGFVVDIEHPQTQVEAIRYLMQESPENAFSNLPVISLFFTTGFYGGWIPFLSVVAVLYARKPKRHREGERKTLPDAPRCDSSERPHLILGIFPVIVCFALLFICPVASPRYVLPMLFGCPLILGWVWFSLSQKHV